MTHCGLFCYIERMRFLFRFLLKVAANALALVAAARFIQGFEILPHSFALLGGLAFSPLTQSFIVGGIVLAVLNMFLRPILNVLSLPFLFITFGLFSVVIHIIILYLADLYLAELVISGFRALFLGSLLIGLINVLIK